MFNITHAKGFHITFANGWTASVQWGEWNYCDNRHKPGVDSSATAEIAAWKGETWFKFENDNVEGYKTPNEVLGFLNRIARL